MFGRTTQQSNAHNTETRTICYPWHPWYGYAVTIRKALAKRERAMFHCQLEPNEYLKALEIPQWMFDSVICAAMRLRETPVVSGEALLRLKTLLADVAVNRAGAVVQTQSHCMSTKGETDATYRRATTEVSTRPISPTPTRARLANAAGTRKAASRETSGATVSRAPTATVPGARKGRGGGR